MHFSEQLNKYIALLDCSSKELAESSSLSQTVISRYRNGERLPSSQSEQLKKLCYGIEKLALSKGKLDINNENVLSSFENTLISNSFDYDKLTSNFNSLASILDINISHMARKLNFDASYISRIRTGKRRPADPQAFVNAVCIFIVNQYSDTSKKMSVAELIGCKYEDISTKDIYLSKLSSWLLNNSQKNHNYIDGFLKKLDEFDLKEYINSIKFDELKVPSIPFQFHTSKNYYGIDEMRAGELDFFKSTVLSKSMEPVFMCNDMPMEDMAKDIDFGKKWMFAIAMMLKKGIHLNMIHNLDRPFNELMLGLESWVPIYMTGQVSPYYLKDTVNNIYCHFNYVSGNFALTGECIKGFHNNGKYYLTNNKEEVAYYKKKAKNMLSIAYPLMEIYRENSRNVYDAFIISDSQTDGERRRILFAPPICTISDKLLKEILNSNSISKNDQEIIRKYVTRERQIITNITEHNAFTDEIAELSKKEFEQYNLALSLSGCFYDKKIYYTYNQYIKHLDETKQYAINNKNYIIKTSYKNSFRNIQIYIHEGKWVMISKDNAPSIHFVIKHTKLRNAIANFTPPITEE